MDDNALSTTVENRGVCRLCQSRVWNGAQAYLLISLQGVEKVALEVVQLGHIPVEFTHSVDESGLLIAQPVSLLLSCPHLQMCSNLSCETE